MNTCEATPSAAQEIRIQSLGTPEIDSPLSRNLATAGERRVVFTVDEELVDEGAAPRQDRRRPCCHNHSHNCQGS